MKSTLVHLTGKPQTNLGSWSVWLEVTFMLMFMSNIPFNIYVIRPSGDPNPAYYVAFILFMLACGVAGGIVGWLALVKQHEHSVLVWASALIGSFALLILLNETLQGIGYMLGV